MARSIALGINIQINGAQQTVKSVDELKQAISTLENEIQTAEFGSEEFKRLSADLAKLKAGFRDINKEIEGADREQALGAFAASVNGVTGAFLVATSAVQAFGVEGKNAEELAKFQARALALVNVALGVRQILEAKVKFEQIQRNVVEKASLIGTRLLTAAQAAYTAVVAGTTGALKALRIAIASTGVGLLVVGLASLISKLTSAKEETTELAEETKTLAEFESEAAQNAGVEVLKIQNLAKVVKNAQVPLEDRVGAYKELQKLVPELAGYTLEEAENLGILNQAINDQIKLIELRARVTALEGFLVEQEKARIAAEQAEAAQRKQTQALIDFNLINQEATRIMNGMGAATFEQAQEMAKALLIRNGTIKQQEDENTVAKELLDAKTQLSTLEGQITTRIGGRTKAQKDANDADKEAIELEKERLRLFNESIKALGQFNLEGQVSAQVLDQANELIERQNNLLNERKSILQEQVVQSEEVADQFKRLVGGILSPEEGIIKFDDVFESIFRNVEKAGGDALTQYQNLQKQVEEFGGVLAVREKIGEKSLQILQDYFSTNIELQQLLGEYNQAAVTAGKEVVNLNIDLSKLVKEIGDIREEGEKSLERESVTQEKIYNLIAKTLFPQTQIEKLSEDQKNTLDSITKSLIQQSGLYAGIADVNDELIEKTAQVQENITAQGQKLDETAFKNLRQFIIDNAESIGAIKETFGTLSVESSNLTQEQIDNINKLIEDVELNNLITRIDQVAQAVVQIFGNVSGQLSSIVSQQNSLLLEQLAYQEEMTLATIGNATEEARQEQERAQKEFAEQRFNLEKRARISELQFALADSIANGAAAYISALTVAPPAGYVLANISALLAAAQIATIRSQIGFTKSKQFIARRGGLIGGASHEMGGMTLNAEGGEFLVNRQAVSQFGDLLSQINTSTGGRPLAMDDSRIVEEIRRQNQRPIKTYVLDQDIQDTRKINARLEQISRL